MPYDSMMGLSHFAPRRHCPLIFRGFQHDVDSSTCLSKKLTCSIPPFPSLYLTATATPKWATAHRRHQNVARPLHETASIFQQRRNPKPFRTKHTRENDSGRQRQQRQDFGSRYPHSAIERKAYETCDHWRGSQGCVSWLLFRRWVDGHQHGMHTRERPGRDGDGIMCFFCLICPDRRQNESGGLCPVFGGDLHQRGVQALPHSLRTRQMTPEMSSSPQA